MCAPEYTSTIVADSPHGVLHQGDCLEIMPTLSPHSVDMILCDLPYGTTACKWDSIIPFVPLWREYRRLIKPRGAIVLTAAQPFTSALVMSNVKDFRHEWVWDKKIGGNFASVKHRPLQVTESILVFGSLPPAYHPIKTKGVMRAKGGGRQLVGIYGEDQALKKSAAYMSDEYHPRNLLEFSNANRKGNVHPTQKPVALFEYLIKTYTQPGATVLDNCAGSGTTGAAAINTGRKFVLIEREQKYVEIIQKRAFSPAETLFSA